MSRKGQSQNSKDDRDKHVSSSEASEEVEAGSATFGTVSASDDDSTSSEADSRSDNESESGSDVSEKPAKSEDSLKDITFGALMEAQAAFPPKSKKRKVPPDFDDAHQNNQNEARDTTSKPIRKVSHPKLHRSSKHAPTTLSSNQQVSRKRPVFEPSPALKSRDPRFDPTVQSANHANINAANKNYSFLTDYQATEILALKTQINNPTTSPALATTLKRQLMSLESKVRAAQSKQRERDIMTQHKQKEKAAIAAGEKTKPYYLKEGEVRKRAKEERLEGMNKRARDKAAARKQKREKTKDARHMPRVRRE